MRANTLSVRHALVLLLGSISCAPETHPTPAPPTTSTLTVDAEISKGSRFVIYCNDAWTAPERQPVVPGERTRYRFPLPATLRTLRFDPSEASDSHVVIYSVVLDMPGMPKKRLPLQDLSSFLKYRCNIKATNRNATVDATGPDMYFMGGVNPASYPLTE